MTNIDKKLEDCVNDALFMCLSLDSFNYYLLKKNEITRSEHESIAQEIENIYWAKYDRLRKLVELYKSDNPLFGAVPVSNDHII
jgi:hypothetical protein